MEKMPTDEKYLTLIKILNDATENNYGDLVASGDVQGMPHPEVRSIVRLMGYCLTFTGSQK